MWWGILSVNNHEREVERPYKRITRSFTLAEKPKRSEVIQGFKFTVAGITLLGLIAFIIHIVIYTILGSHYSIILGT